MATREQTRANKENARSSTGPRTAAGKAKSSQNALKHGLRAQATVLPDENLDEFEFLVSELEDQFQPQTALEWNLLRQLADAEWRMRRIPGLEAALFAAKLHQTVRYYRHYPEKLPDDEAEAGMILIGEAAESDARNGDTFSKLSRYEARLSHRYFKAVEHLQKAQSLRQRAADPEKHAPPAPGPNRNGANGTRANANETGTRRNNGNNGSNDDAQAAGFVRPPTPAGPKAVLNSTQGQIAAGDPSPVPKGRVHPEGGVASRQPPPSLQGPPKRAKRTQFQCGGNVARGYDGALREENSHAAGPAQRLEEPWSGERSPQGIPASPDVSRGVEARGIRSPWIQGTRSLARETLERYSEHGDQAQRSRRGFLMPRSRLLVIQARPTVPAAR